MNKDVQEMIAAFLKLEPDRRREYLDVLTEMLCSSQRLVPSRAKDTLTPRKTAQEKPRALGTAWLPAVN